MRKGLDPQWAGKFPEVGGKHAATAKGTVFYGPRTPTVVPENPE